MTKEIVLTGGQVALVDEEDFDQLSQYTWKASRKGNTFYAERSEKKVTIMMHREIMNAPSNMEVDHIDGNGLNNTKANLRLCSHTENMRNQKMAKSNKTGFKGVMPYYKNGFRAMIYFEGKSIHIGVYDTAEEAAKAYDRKAVELFGEFARTNF